MGVVLTVPDVCLPMPANAPAVLPQPERSNAPARRAGRKKNLFMLTIFRNEDAKFAIYHEPTN